jgi:hypothetical protein
MLELLKRYPQTFVFVSTLISMGAVLALSALWHPGLWIVIGVITVWILIRSIRRDRQRR